MKLSEVDLDDRIDAEFFSKEDLHITTKLRNIDSVEFRDLGEFVASAFYPAATQLYKIGDTPFIRCVDCIDYPIISKLQDATFEKIPFSFIGENNGVNLLSRNDLIITKVGSPCYASLVFEHDVIALSRTVMGVRNIKKINPFYLMIFLRSKYGFLQLLRARELTIQYQLTLERVKRILIPVFPKPFQNKIADLVRLAHKKFEQSERLYKEAEKILEEELDIDIDSVMEKRAVECSEMNLSSSLMDSGRLDAEYYQRKYDNLFSLLAKGKTRVLEEIVKIRKSIEPGSECYLDSGIPFYRVSNLSVQGLSVPEIFLDRKQFNDVACPKKDNILLSKDGSVCIAYKLQEDLDGITSGALLHLVVEDKEVLPDYLALILNSKFVKMQAERDAGGSIIRHWKVSEIERVIIPILPQDVQSAIAEKIKESFSLREEGKRLFDEAKLEVEQEIEEKK